mmetsp:Transcript_10921/g.19473  ORF Transcript_10921/g.19473 Transcript_10921/m.19473 type:complete len:92 (+) Transcript_10921:655-930(+)
MQPFYAALARELLGPPLPTTGAASPVRLERVCMEECAMMVTLGAHLEVAFLILVTLIGRGSTVMCIQLARTASKMAMNRRSIVGGVAPHAH